jgi:hypothetical protein
VHYQPDRGILSGQPSVDAVQQAAHFPWLALNFREFLGPFGGPIARASKWTLSAVCLIEPRVVVPRLAFDRAEQVSGFGWTAGGEVA